jgi:proteasome accessory factor A
MNRIVGLETEYGCLVADERSPGGPDAWPVRVKNHAFRKASAGAIDLHYRDYEEPPGNGGFLLNGGRLYLDMGHLEYSSPECLSVDDLVAYDLAGDLLVQSALEELGVADRVSLIKNNVDHHTGATFGCHENYLMRRDAEFTPDALAALLSFLATRQIFCGAGRVGVAHPLAFDFEPARDDDGVTFQLSQRADHIVNDIYQWVQFNRAIINARDEPLADYRKYRRLHLLIGDSNMSPFACALKCGTTALVLTLLEEGWLPPGWALEDAVHATRAISRDANQRWLVTLADGRTCDALDVQRGFLASATACLRGQDAETDWLLDQWSFTLDCLRAKPEALIGGVDWITKRWLLQTFREAEGLEWEDPWLQSLDLEYHNLNPKTGLFHGIEAPSKTIGEFNARARRPSAIATPPSNTRAWGRGIAIKKFMNGPRSYVVNWDAVSLEGGSHLPMGDPFRSYDGEIRRFLSAGDTT